MERQNFGLVARTALVGLIICTAICAAACGGSSSPTPPAPSTPATAKFHLEGIVVSLDKQQQQIVVDHKEIAGFMGAMTMPYPVKTPSDLDRVSAGDQITADLVSSDGQFKLDNIVVVKRSETKVAPPSGAKPPGR